MIGLDAEPGFDNPRGRERRAGGRPVRPTAARSASPRSPTEDPGQRLLRARARPGDGVGVPRGAAGTPWAGAGGGGGGDAAKLPPGQSFPSSTFVPGGDEKGAGGGGGGGSVHILSLGPIRFGPSGQIKARGGPGGGGENTIFLNRVGGGSGGGSGGHVVLETAAFVDLSQAQGFALDVRGGQGGAGKDDRGGAYRTNTGIQETSPKKDACPPGFTGCLGHVDGAGGDGSPGLIQLHVPVSDAANGRVLLPPGTTLAELATPAPVGAGEGCQFLPSFEVPSAPVLGATVRRWLRADLRWRAGLEWPVD